MADVPKQKEVEEVKKKKEESEQGSNDGDVRRPTPTKRLYFTDTYQVRDRDGGEEKKRYGW